MGMRTSPFLSNSKTVIFTLPLRFYPYELIKLRKMEIVFSLQLFCIYFNFNARISLRALFWPSLKMHQIQHRHFIFF
ncbi:hypothetical protein CW304_01975 [Bacillus sp. UFRGS-B20]|nr:hypothetical protein CW304_01975 [Bacillus sp. UFRGS-B20]